MDEVLAAHASSDGDTLIADVDQVVVLDEAGRSPGTSDAATVVIDLSEPVAAAELADVFPEELFAQHGPAAPDEVATAPPVVPPPAEPDVEPVPDEPEVDPDAEPEPEYEPEPVGSAVTIDRLAPETTTTPETVGGAVTADPSAPETATTPEPGPPDPVPPEPVPPEPVPPEPVPPDPLPPDPVLPDPLPPEPEPLVTARPSTLPRAVAAPKVSSEAAAAASRIVAEVLAEHAAREAAAAAAAAEAELRETEAIAAQETEAVEGRPSTVPELPIEADDALETTAELPATDGSPTALHEPLPQTEEIRAAPGAMGEQGADGPAADAGLAAPITGLVTDGWDDPSLLEMPNGPAGTTAINRAVLDAPPPDLDERKLSANEDEFPAPRRTGRWLVTTVLGAVSLAFLFPLAVRALRELISLS